MSPPVLVGIHSRRYRSRNQERAGVHTSSAKIWAGKASQCRYADDESVCIMQINLMQYAFTMNYANG